MADFQSKNECLDAVILKHNSIIEEMCHMHIKVQNLEQRQQQQPQQQPFSQLPFEGVKLEKPQTQQMYQNNLQRRQPQQNKKPRVLHHVSEYDEPLKSSSNAWRPTKKRGMMSDDEDIIRQFRSLLNKLTPENFDRIIHQMKRINITKEGHLKDIVQLVLNKAMMESKFSEVYANMCSHLSKIAVHETSKPGNILNFHILLIQGCQDEYVIGMDGSSSLDNEAFKEKARQRALGNIIFIGELFNAEVLHESIISDIVRELLKDGKEQSLEYLCRLLGVVGQNLDSKQPAMINEYFTSLNELLKGKKMSSRIRFMLQDLIDLRKVSHSCLRLVCQFTINTCLKAFACLSACILFPSSAEMDFTSKGSATDVPSGGS
uniref:MIF4G domain-containing protein n=1 Tax=Eptatretus burgeri TaxID=7764 RepID=A0A8C4WRX8_EPTBU